MYSGVKSSSSTSKLPQEYSSLNFVSSCSNAGFAEIEMWANYSLEGEDSDRLFNSLIKIWHVMPL